MSAAEQRQFVAAFGQHFAEQLISRFPTGDFTIFEAEDADGPNTASTFLTVRTVFATNTSSHVIEWWVGTVGGQLKIFDVLIDAKSLVESKKRDYAAFLQDNDGSVSALIARLAG